MFKYAAGIVYVPQGTKLYGPIFVDWIAAHFARLTTLAVLHAAHPLFIYGPLHRTRLCRITSKPPDPPGAVLTAIHPQLCS